jgi:hypothetical protein
MALFTCLDTTKLSRQSTVNADNIQTKHKGRLGRTSPVQQSFLCLNCVYTSLPERNSRPSLFAPQYSRIRRFALRNRDTFSHAGYGIPSATGSLSPIKYNRSSIDQLLQHTWATNSLDFCRNISLTPWMHDCPSKHENERQRDLPISGKQVIRIVLQLQRTVLPINARTSSRQVISCRLVSS